MSDITILCVTGGELYAAEFLGEMQALALNLDAPFVTYDGSDGHYLENVLDDALDMCDTEYVFRLDDDEKVSNDLAYWLFSREYRTASHWCFPRMNLWPTEDSYIGSQPLWPDLQTRLSTLEKSGGRNEVHVGSPFGSGKRAPAAIEHWKFLVRPETDRRRLVERYERIRPGAGCGFYAQYSVPEDIVDLEVVVRARVVAA